MIKNGNAISRELSKEKVDRIHRLRVEIEKIREENVFLLNKLEKYDDWLFDSIDEINNLLDKNISEDSYDYEEDSIEYDFDPNDLNFGEKKKSKLQLQKKNKKNNADSGGSISVVGDNKNNEQNFSCPQIKPKTGSPKKDKVDSAKIPSKITNNCKNSTFKIPQSQTAQLNPSVSTEGSSPLEVLFKLNPQLAAQILRPFIEEYKKKISQNAKEKDDNTNTETEKTQNSDLKNKAGTISQDETENTEDLLSKAKANENKCKDEESFDDL